MKNDKLAHRPIDPPRDQYPSKTTKRRTEITIETREIKTIRIRSFGGAIYCTECCEQTTSYSPEHIAAILRLNVPDIMQALDRGDIHLVANGSSDTDICGNSLDYLVSEHCSDEPAVTRTAPTLIEI